MPWFTGCQALPRSLVLNTPPQKVPRYNVRGLEALMARPPLVGVPAPNGPVLLHREAFPPAAATGRPSSIAVAPRRTPLRLVHLIARTPLLTAGPTEGIRPSVGPPGDRLPAAL